MTDVPFTECPRCGKVFGDNRAMSTHYANVHGESLSLTEYQCDNCGKEFERRRRVATETTNHFCSRPCQGEFLARSASATVECDWCGSEFSRRQSTVSERNFCDRECYLRFRRAGGYRTAKH